MTGVLADSSVHYALAIGDYILEKAMSDSYTAERQASAEIEITPEMIEASSAFLSDYFGGDGMSGGIAHAEAEFASKAIAKIWREGLSADTVRDMPFGQMLQGPC